MKSCAVPLAIIVVIASMGVNVEAGKGALYQTANNVTYYINQEYAYTWYEAFLECSYLNMTLLNLDSDVQFNELHQLLMSRKFVKKPPHLWIGAVGSNRKFVWASTGKPMITTHWGPGNPDNTANIENCVQIFENTKHFNDIKCMEKFGFVCGLRKTSCRDDSDSETGGNSKDIGKYRGMTFYFNQGKYSL